MTVEPNGDAPEALVAELQGLAGQCAATTPISAPFQHSFPAKGSSANGGSFATLEGHELPPSGFVDCMAPASLPEVSVSVTIRPAG